MATGPRRGSGRAAGTGGCLREPRRAQPPLGRTAPAAPAVARRAGRARDRGGPGLRGRHRRPRREPRLRLDRGHGLRPVVRAASRLVGRRPRDRPAHRAAPAAGARTRPGPLPLGAPDLRRTGRHRGAGHAGAAPGHPARRHRPRPALRLRRLRVHLRAGLGPAPCPACSTGASCSPTPTSAVAARAAGAGGSTAGWRTSRTRSPTTSRSPTGWPAWWTATGSRRAGSAPAACSRAWCSRQRPDRWRGRGRGGAVRRRGHHDVRRLHPADGQRSGTSGATRGAGRSSTGCSAYSPYDNLRRPGTRPDLLVTGALHDPRVMVIEPAKWVAALRESDPEWSPRCLFRGRDRRRRPRGPSGRYGPAGLRGGGLRLAAGPAWRSTDAPVSNELGC